MWNKVKGSDTFCSLGPRTINLRNSCDYKNERATIVIIFDYVSRRVNTRVDTLLLHLFPIKIPADRYNSHRRAG